MIEAMKLVRDAIEQGVDLNLIGAKHILDQAIADAEKQEPVAVKHMMEWVAFLKARSANGQHKQIPSYLSAGACWDLAVELEQFINTHPQPKAEKQEPVAKYIGETYRCPIVILYQDITVGTLLYTHPQPKREWVGLTDEEIEDCYKQGGIGRAIQLLKEKNT